MDSLKGKVFVVTGATSGIGKDTALYLAGEGAKVVVSGRREKEGAEVVEAVKAKGSEGLFVQVDVAQEKDLKKLASETVAAFGDIHGCFVNAGVWGDPKAIVDEQKANIDQVIDINVKGVLYTIKHIAPHIVSSGGGSIVTNSSILGIRAMPGLSVYCASKFAVEGITRTAALELAANGVRVNCVAPGPIETDMLSEASGGDPSGFATMIPMGRIGQPKEISSVVAWLFSNESQYVSGQVIAVDGAYTAG